MASAPIQCSDDTGGQATFQTGQEVPGSELQPRPRQQADDSDIQRDAETDPRDAVPPRQQAAGSKANASALVPDTITIKGENSTIVATGLLANLKPGTQFVMGETNVVNFYQGGSGGSGGSVPHFAQAKRPITANQNPPGTKHMDVVTDGIGSEWRMLGRRLGLTDSKLDIINMDFDREGQREKTHQVLVAWKIQESERATVQRLAQTLADIRRGDLADKLSMLG